MHATIFVGLLAQALIALAQQRYILEKEYSGSTFFNGWDFYGSFDNLTNGDAVFISAAENANDRLAYVNGAGNAIIKVDNATNVAFNQKRNTVRITSQDRFAVGSVWVADMLHVPFGCSVWPAWWSQAPDWPTGGEIDTFEGVNQVTLNQMALHTEPGCTQQNPKQSSSLVNSTDCSFQSNSNQGCVVTVPNTQSYGAGFASAGGGVYVTAFVADGISIWFFPRASVPSSLSTNSSSIDLTTLGTPTANWPNTGCDINNYFAPQHLIFDITLCGDFAGASNVFAETCTGRCYNDWVIGPPSNYDNAYFEIQHVRVFGATGVNSVEVDAATTTRVSLGKWGLIGLGAVVGLFTL